MAGAPRRALGVLGATLAAASPQVAAAQPAAPPPAAAAAPSPWRFDAFATVSPFAAFDSPSTDGHGPSAKGIVEYGVGGGAAYRLRGPSSLGLGLRYDHGASASGGASFHVVAAPLTILIAFPLGDARTLGLALGGGPAFGISPTTRIDGHALQVFGISGELALAFTQRVRAGGLAVCLQAGIRYDVLSERNAGSSDYLRGKEMIHGQLPFVRLGAAWR